MSVGALIWVPWLSAIAAVVCGLCCARPGLRGLAAPVSIGALGLSFLMVLLASGGVEPGGAAHIIDGFRWLSAGGFEAGYAAYVDPLTVVMLMVITGVGTLVALYAAGYMSGERGYARFFAGVSLFIFAMTTLVLADNMVLLYLGWEGVGLCSYLLIGFYYQKPAAVAAAKKAFIVNRVGDLGFALGIMLTYQQFGTVSFGPLFEALSVQPDEAEFSVRVIPFLLMLGAFGKSAQLPLHVWLPDAMEGPTPVSALIHAATMVTAGVYMIARLLPLFELSPMALPVVATVGGVTALFAATIALCQHDLKRVWAYSTISQLGYMFLGVGAAATVGGVFHLFTHAFFKALLFLTAGSVMHGLHGQLDLRKMSGMWSKMPWTGGLTLVGCLALAGFPLTSGFVSKDMILAGVMEKGLAGGSWLYFCLGIMSLVAAFLTAFYTFRVWFRVFLGPTHYEMGSDHGHDEDGDTHGAIEIEHHREPHEMGWLMNGPLVVLAIGALFAGLLCHGWIEEMVLGSSAATVRMEAAHVSVDPAVAVHHATLFGMELHTAVQVISGAIALAGILLAAYYHWLNRRAAELIAEKRAALVGLLNQAYRVDSLYDGMIVTPLRGIAYGCLVFDRMVIEAAVAVVGFVPRMMGLGLRPAQRGMLQGYGLGMAAGTAVLVLLVIASG